jgi:LacI family transcriptional regulator
LNEISNVKAAGIKDIARALGVSIGTVDRALHGRPGINPMTRSRVLKMAQTLGYRPNFAARHLKLNKKLRISVHLPQEIALFFDVLRGGILEAAGPFQSTIDVQFRSYPRLGEGDVELFEEALREETNGIILTPGHPAALRPWIRKAARKRIPVVCVATDAPGTERLTSISSDPYTSGSMVAELLTRCVRLPGPVLLVTGDLSTNDHAEKVRGFQESLASMQSPLELVRIVEAHDQPDQAYQRTRECLSEHPDLRAVYVSTANSIPVLRALDETGVLDRIAVMTTDLFPALVPLIRSGRLLGTVYQRPREQGRMAFQALYKFLVEGTCPQVRHRLPPHIILRSNLELFLEMLPGDFEEVVSPQENPEAKSGKRMPRRKKSREAAAHPSSD